MKRIVEVYIHKRNPNDIIDDNCILAMNEPAEEWYNSDIVIIDINNSPQFFGPQYFDDVVRYISQRKYVIVVRNFERSCMDELADIIEKQYIINNLFDILVKSIKRREMCNKWGTWMLHENNQLIAIVGPRMTQITHRNDDIINLSYHFNLTAKTAHYIGRDKFVYFHTFLICLKINKLKIPRPLCWIIINQWYFD